MSLTNQIKAETQILEVLLEVDFPGSVQNTIVNFAPIVFISNYKQFNAAKFLAAIRRVRLMRECGLEYLMIHYNFSKKLWVEITSRLGSVFIV